MRRGVSALELGCFMRDVGHSGCFRKRLFAPSRLVARGVSCRTLATRGVSSARAGCFKRKIGAGRWPLGVLRVGWGVGLGRSGCFVRKGGAGRGVGCSECFVRKGGVGCFVRKGRAGCRLLGVFQAQGRGGGVGLGLGCFMQDVGRSGCFVWGGCRPRVARGVSCGVGVGAGCWR